MAERPNVPGYELLERLGGGATSAVYAAKSRATGEACAVKLLREDWWDDANAVALIRREARVGLRTLHRHLIRIYDAHVSRPPFFLVMPLLEGETVRDRIRREFALDIPTAVWITRQIAEALAALHRAGFVHGDIKPENIRLIDTGTAVLVDLGFAHKPGENADLMAEGFVMGTANYIAPELCEADGRDEPPADVFGLGVALFEMLTGALPFAAGSVSETMLAHRDATPRNLAEVPGDWPTALTTLVRRMMARDPDERPKASAIVQHAIAVEIATLRRAG